MTIETEEDISIGNELGEDLLLEPETEIGQKEPTNILGTEVGSFQQYMRAITRYSLLSADEEKALGRRIAIGDKEAFNIMVNSNLRLVVKIARKHTNQRLLLDDLVQAGNLGLMKAAEKFEPDKGFRFSTYATWWIRADIERALINQGHAIRIPVHMDEIIQDHIKTRNLLERNGNKVSSRDIEEWIGAGSGTESDIQKLQLLRQTASLDHPLSDDSKSDTLISMIPNMQASGPEQQLHYDNVKKILEELLADIPERNRNMIRLRYGLGNVDHHTLRVIGNIHNIGEESARQTIERTLEQIRAKKEKLAYLFEDLDVA